jgi:hypothetical protein
MRMRRQLSPHSRRSIAAALASALLLPMVHSRVLAQADEIPDTVLITGSLIGGVAAPRTDPGRLTQLTSRELRSLLHGAGVHAAGDNLHVYSFGCGGDWTYIGARVPVYGRYSIRNNQYCVQAQVGASYQYCAKLYRSETGELFGELDPPPYFSPRGVPQVEITPFSPACPR